MVEPGQVAYEERVRGTRVEDTPWSDLHPGEKDTWARVEAAVLRARSSEPADDGLLHDRVHEHEALIASVPIEKRRPR